MSVSARPSTPLLGVICASAALVALSGCDSIVLGSFISESAAGGVGGVSSGAGSSGKAGEDAASAGASAAGGSSAAGGASGSGSSGSSGTHGLGGFSGTGGSGASAGLGAFGGSSGNEGGAGGEGGDAPTPPRWEPEPDTSIIGTLGIGAGLLDDDPENDWVYVGYESGNVYRTRHGRVAEPDWTLINPDTVDSPIRAYVHVMTIAIHPQDPHDVWIGFAGDRNGAKLFHTVDGSNWQMQNSGLPGEVWTVSHNPLEPRFMYAMTAGGPVYTNDGGLSWSSERPSADPLQPPLAEGDKITAVTRGRTTDEVLIGTLQGALWTTSNASGAQTWTALGVTGLTPARAVTRVTYQYTNSGREVYVTYRDMLQQSVWVHRINRWLNLHGVQLPSLELPAYSMGYLGVSVNPVDSDWLYVNYTFGAARSRDRGTTWVRTDAP